MKAVMRYGARAERLPEATRWGLYERMFLIRAVEQAIRRVYFRDEMRTPMHMSMGAEAIAVGVCAALREGDQVVGSYRAHAAYLALTNDVEGFFGEMLGKVTGPARGRAGSMHLLNPALGYMAASAVVGSQVPMALGLAFAHQRMGTGNVAVCFIGDGVLDQGVFWESLNAACAFSLPVIFVLEDNGLAVETPFSARHSAQFSLREAVQAFGASYKQPDDPHGVDGVFRAAKGVRSAQEALPALLHVRYVRYLEHLGVNAGSVKAEDWLDPVARWRPVLMAERVVAGDALLRMEGEVEARVEAALQAARAASAADASEALQGVQYRP